MSTLKALLVAAAVAAISCLVLTFIHGTPTNNQLIKGGATMFAIAFAVMKFTGGTSTARPS